ADIPQNQWLSYYAQQFNTVELNATFYRSFSKETYINWYHKVPKDFRFVIKMSRYVTHQKRLIDVKESIQNVEKNSEFLKEKLGLILLQLPPDMPYHLERL